jgi:hypothetical protein
MDSEKEDRDREKSSSDWAMQIYERAQDNSFHCDVITYEVAAIVWSANVLLLGFILEVPLTPAKQELVLAAAIVSLVFTSYVPYVMRFTKIGQRVAVKICLEIEEKEQLPNWLRFHSRIHEIYPKRRGQFAVYAITVIFLLLWLYVGFRAVGFICKS